MKSEDRREIAFQIDFDLDGHVIIAEEREKSGNPSFTSSPKWIKTEFTGDNIKSIFREESRIRQILPNYKYRKPQEDLAVRLGQAFKNKVHSIIEAPTGTGKTLGYLLPSAVFALSENQQVLIATGTKILQNQILTKDSIDLYRTFGFEPNELKIKKLVGSNNHFCELLFREERSEKFQSQDQKISEIFFEMVFYYNSNRSEPLTREEIPFVLKKKLPHMEAREKQIAVDFRSCSGQKCPFKNGCSYIEGLRQAKAANIIIGNHSLLYNWTKSFPLPDHIVVDEAHRLERETTAAFTLEFGQRAMENFQQNLKSLNGLGSLFYLIIKGSSTQEESEQIIADVKRKILSISENMEMVLTPLPELFEDYFKRLPKYTSLYWNEASFFRLEEKNDPLVVSLSKKILILHELLQDLSKILTFYSEDYNGKDENDIVAITKFNNFVGVLNDLFLPLDLAVKPKEGYVSTLKYHEEYGYALCSSPINVGKLVYENLLSNAKSVVFTSATLGGFSESAGIRGVEWALGYPYLSPEKRFKQGLYLGPVYNYEKNAKIFLCDDVPSLGDPNFLPKVLYLIFNLVRNLQGRSLLLFSSKDRFELAREMLLKEFEGEIPLFIQGMGGSVVEEFKKSNNGILLGLETFGEGIDIPGNDLVFVFIDKIPDIRMDLVINERRQFYERTFGNEFVDYYLASRAISLHQKLGRLLRNENDRGGAIIVDSRVKIWKGKTLEKFFKLMKPYSIKKASLNVALQELEDFILPQLKEC